MSDVVWVDFPGLKYCIKVKRGFSCDQEEHYSNSDNHPGIPRVQRNRQQYPDHRNPDNHHDLRPAPLDHLPVRGGTLHGDPQGHQEQPRAGQDRPRRFVAFCLIIVIILYMFRQSEMSFLATPLILIIICRPIPTYLVFQYFIGLFKIAF